MTHDFFFKYSPELERLLGPGFTSGSKGHAIISNNPDEAEIYAPEINFYIRNSREIHDKQANNIKRIYQARLDEFEYSRENRRTRVIGKRLLLVSAPDPDNWAARLAEAGFEVSQVQPDQDFTLTGERGAFSIISGDGSTTIVDRIAWFNAPQEAIKRDGLYDPAGQDPEMFIAKLRSEPEEIDCTNQVHFQKALCLQQNSSANVCSICYDRCQHNAIVKGTNGSSPEILHLSCTGCGECIGACPTGALDATWLPRNTFARICSHYQGKVLLVLPREIDLDIMGIELPAEVLPLTLKNIHVLDEHLLLTLLQSTGREAVVYCPPNSGFEGAYSTLINEITTRKAGFPLIHYCTSSGEIKQALANLKPDCGIPLYAPKASAPKRAETALRLSELVGDQDMGAIDAGYHPQFGTLTIDPTKCTLCLACAGACRMDALSVHPEDNSLRFTTALCVQCGHCQSTCPEPGCLHVLQGTFPLSPETFRSSVMARDELFACAECGKEFAPKKAVEKILAAMTPLFSTDPVKLKTLSCCPECKGKIMLEQQLVKQEQG